MTVAALTHTSDRLQPESVRANVPLASHTTFKVGGQAEWYCEPQSNEALKSCWTWAAERDLRVTLMGLGSNMLISDRGLPGLVINLRRLRGHELLGDGRLWAAAGEPIVKLAHVAARQGWRGMEWAVGIPGTVGGAVTMNAGAHGASTAEILESVTVLDDCQQLRQLSPAELGFAYRTSVLQTRRRWLVTGAIFQLEPGGEPEQVKAQTQANWAHRSSTQPYNMPSCGSVFRNPQPRAAGWLIEQTGLKGHCLGGAQVAERHANFILNRDRATATDIHSLIRFVQERVRDRWSLILHPEVRVLGEFERPLLSA
ncbi:MAG: UDP-N-acetylmuramate dehydrogenase [Cyanobacteria bacterium P01_E01_bin.48]